MGNGDFIETMLRNNMLPSGMDPQNPYHTYDYKFPSRGLASPNGHEALPSALAFHRRISILAAELGLLARDIRAEEKQSPDDTSYAVVQSRQERIGVLQDTLRRTWNVQMPVSVASGYCNQILPVGARGIFEHVSDSLSSCLLQIRSSCLQAIVADSLKREISYHLFLLEHFRFPKVSARNGRLKTRSRINTYHFNSHSRYTAPA